MLDPNDKVLRDSGITVITGAYDLVDCDGRVVGRSDGGVYFAESPPAPGPAPEPALPGPVKRYVGAGGIRLPGDGRMLSPGEEVTIHSGPHAGEEGTVSDAAVGSVVLDYYITPKNGREVLWRVKPDQLVPKVNP